MCTLSCDSVQSQRQMKKNPVVTSPDSYRESGPVTCDRSPGTWQQRTQFTEPGTKTGKCLSVRLRGDREKPIQSYKDTKPQ